MTYYATIDLGIDEDKMIMNNDKKMREIYSTQKFDTKEFALIGFLSNLATKPFNDIRIDSMHHTLEYLGSLIGFSRNTTSQGIRMLEEKNLVRMVKNGNQTSIIYLNPDYFYINKPTEQSTIDLFNSPLKRDSGNPLEKDLELELIKDLSIIEDGMKLIDNQFKVFAGYIDILAEDKNGLKCIIELKITDNDHKIVEQSIYYPLQFKEKTRMITITPGYSHKIESCLNALGYVEMKTYKISEGNIEIENYK